jgi:ATP synthase protein I
MSDEQTDAEPIGEDARLSSLNARLDAARQKEAARKPTPDQEKSDANYRMGNRVLAELIGGLRAARSSAGSSTSLPERDHGGFW